jgi:hypothetical protein
VLAFSAIFFIALVNLLLGINTQTQHSYYSDTSSGALIYYLYTLVFGVLGVCTVLKYKVALGIAFGLYSADSVLMLLVLAANGVTSGGTMLGFLLRGVVLVLMWRGFVAIRALEYEEFSSSMPVTSKTGEAL